MMRVQSTLECQPSGMHQVSPRSFKLMFIAATSFLILAAVYSSMLIVQRQASLRAVSRYDATWLLSQAALEVARLEAVIAASTIPGAQISQDDVRLWLDIVSSRVTLLDSGEVHDFIQSDPKLQAIDGDFRAAIAAARPLGEVLDQPGNATILLRQLADLNPKLMRLASSAYTRSGDLVGADLEQLSRLHWIFSGVLTGLILCSFSLILVMFRQNRLLIQAHREVNGLVIDLKRTTQKLSEANERTQHAVEEAQLQNQILKVRDLELHTQNARFDAALNNMSQALCMVDADQRLIVCNVRFRELFGLSQGVVQPGTQMADVFRAMAAIGRYEQELIEALRNEQQTLVFAHSPGRFLHEVIKGPAVAVSHQPMVGGGWVATYEDVTERQQAEARIRFMAHHDALTSLPNRVLFNKRMESMLRKPSRRGEQLALHCLDLDYFKNVNDTLGHPVGDALLEMVAERLRHCMREDDVVARLGGDEFAILQCSSEHPLQAELLAQRIVETVCRPYDLNGHRAVISVSIGIAIASKDGTSTDMLLKNADMALYRAKADGRATYRFFEAEMDTQMQARRAMELDLREAITRGELEVYYQPFFDLTANKISGFEALLRWNHATLGMISPAQFIPLAEELGLILSIGEWVLQMACKDAACWPDHLRVAVNLSPVQFRNEYLVDTVVQALRQSGLSAERLELEITESTLLQDNERVVATLHAMRRLGLRIALDDFGTGYSSLSYLRSFPFDKLKIDQSFVREMATRPDCLAIVNSVAALAQQLGITTTAEGIETIRQLDHVRAAGCAEAQGYYFSVPQPVTSISHWWIKSAPIAVVAA